MKYRWSARLAIVLIVAGIGAMVARGGPNLGIDFQGGMHIVLEVDDPDGTMTAEAKSGMIDQVVRIIRTRIDEFGVNEPLIQKVGSERVIVELAGLQGDEDRAKEIVQRNAYLSAEPVFGKSNLIYTLVRADGSVIVPLDKGGLYAGEEVAVRLY